AFSSAALVVMAMVGLGLTRFSVADRKSIVISRWCMAPYCLRVGVESDQAPSRLRRGGKDRMTDTETDTETWYSNATATFGDRLADARQAQGMSQEDLARRLGVKTTTLARWEDDQAEPRANRLSMLSGLLNVSLGWLLTGEGEGLSAPVDGPGMPDDIRDILTELRQTQSDLVRLAGRVGHLEKRLKRVWK